MKNKKIKIASAVVGMAIVTGGTLPAYVPTTHAFALSRANAAKIAESKDAARITDFISRADKEINRRIEALNTLNTRIQSMKKISDTQKASLKNSIQGQIATLNNLKQKIDADTDLQTVRTDVQSITKSYRVFALAIPQGATVAAADRALTLADSMDTLGDKLESRIEEAKTAGKDVISLEKSLTDYDAKVKDAQTQAQAAIDAVSSLTPDGGDKAKMEANLKAMKDARAKIQAAQQDFVAASKDAKDIVKGLRTLGTTKTKTTTEKSSN